LLAIHTLAKSSIPHVPKDFLRSASCFPPEPAFPLLILFSSDDLPGGAESSLTGVAGGTRGGSGGGVSARTAATELLPALCCELRAEARCTTSWLELDDDLLEAAVRVSEVEEGVEEAVGAGRRRWRVRPGSWGGRVGRRAA
jgi:hypothetical protein